MNWQDLLKQKDDELLTSDDPQAQAAVSGWKQIAANPEVQKALDFSGNLKAYDDDATAHVKSMTDMLRTGVASNPDADLKMAQHSLGTAMGTIKADELTPNEKIRQLAQEYMKAKKIPSLPDQPYAKVDTNVAKKIANAYEEMKHDPENPEVKAAYKALIDETVGQFQKLKESGLKIDKITGENPYKSSSDLFKDIKDNNHISYYPTKSGFGTETSTSNHPLLAKSGEQINGEDVPANDIFRIVHDYFGHAKEGPGFGPRGEENAFREHAQMYSPEALKALATETRGQNSWVNYGPKGEANRANPANTTFAEQKAGLLPDWASEFNKTLDTLKPELPMDEASRSINVPEGYTIKDSGTANPDIHHVNVFDKNGENVGNSIFQIDRNNNSIIPMQVHVDPDHQRKGLATAMHQFMEKVPSTWYGNPKYKMAPSSEQTDQGRALWKSFKEKGLFGNSNDSDSGNIAAALGALGIGGAASQMNEEEKFSDLKKKLGL